MRSKNTSGAEAREASLFRQMNVGALGAEHLVNVFLAPAGTYLHTISEGIVFDAVRPVLSRFELANLPSIAQDKKLRFWGCRKGAITLWERMGRDDIVLFVPKQLGVYTDYGRVALKSQNPALAEEMQRTGYWPGGFEYIFFIKDYKRIAIPKVDVNKMANWGPGVPYRFMRVASQKVRDDLVRMTLDTEAIRS